MKRDRTKILLIEDNPGEARLIREMLSDAEELLFDLTCAERLSTGLKCLAKGGIDIVLLDFSLPGREGIDALAHICLQASDVPIVIIADMESDELVVKAIQEGAQDYLVKERMDNYSLSHAILFALARHQAQRELRRSAQQLQSNEIRYIAKLKRNEEALEAQREYARSIINSSMDMIVAVDKDRRITEFNRAAQETFGYRPEEVLGKHANILYADKNEGLKVHKATLEKDRYAAEIINRRKNGACFPCFLSASILRDERGEPVGMMGASRDITESKEAEKTLRESETRLKSVVDHMPHGVCLLDNARRVVMANALAREYLKVIGDRMLKEAPRPRVDALAHEVAVEGPPRRIFKVTPNRIMEETIGEGWVLVVREVTRERAAQAQTQQQERLAAVGQMAAGIAHDFNNMLSVMMGFAQMLEMRDDIPGRVKEGLCHIFEQGKRAAQLIRQILDFSCKSTAERQRMDLLSFLKEAGKLLAQLLPETIRITTEFGDGVCLINGNPTQLQQVFINLAINARDAMPRGGELRVALSRLRIEPGEALPMPGMAPGDWVVWTVSDTGVGMPPAVLARIYDPFFSTKRPSEGMGLGLAQVYGLVKQHKGGIDVESEVGRGTTFTIYLPEATGEVTSHQEEIFDVSTGQGETILLVEDNLVVLDAVRTMLDLLGYRVLTASNGREALDVYEVHRNRIGLVLADMVMPEMGGAELFEALKKRDPEIRVVFMTGYSTETEKNTPLTQKAAGYLQKPLLMETVAQVIRKALAGG